MSNSVPNQRRSPLPWVIGIIAVVLAYLFAVTVIPRWWPQRIGDMVNGKMTAGSIAGVVIGLIFTVLPALVLWMGWRMRDGWRRGMWFIVAAAVLAIPNLATLGVVLGNGNAAHAGERIFDTEAPGFRGGTLIGAVVGLALMAWIVWLAGSRRRNRAKARGYRDELRRRADDDA